MRWMNARNVSTIGLLTLLFIVLSAGRAQPAPLTDDRAITLHSAREIATKRKALIQYLWGAEGFPDRRLPAVLTNVPSPVKQLSHLARELV